MKRESFFRQTWEWWLCGAVNGLVARYYFGDHQISALIFIVAVPVIFVTIYYWRRRSQ